MPKPSVKNPAITLAEAIEIFLDDQDERKRRYEEARVFCDGDDKALNALDIVNRRMSVIESKKWDFIKTLFGSTKHEMQAMVVNIKEIRKASKEAADA